jgi:hypothetical protein
LSFDEAEDQETTMIRALVFGLVGLVALTLDVNAQERGGVVTGCSSFGKRCISGPTRTGRFGREVRMPGGTWIGCRGSCADTLRDETVDFWTKRDNERPNGGFRRR